LFVKGILNEECRVKMISSIVSRFMEVVVRLIVLLVGMFEVIEEDVGGGVGRRVSGGV
jgi:hypothetical protein